MERKSVKRIPKKTKIAKKVAKKGAYISLLFLSSCFSFCGRQKKTLSLALLALVLIFGVRASYQYVQARMQETTSFSDKFILDKVGKHISLPPEYPSFLVRVEDPEKLRKEHPFYANVKEGDYLIAYPKLFIIYDALHDEIRAIKNGPKKEEAL